MSFFSWESVNLYQTYFIHSYICISRGPERVEEEREKLDVTVCVVIKD